MKYLSLPLVLLLLGYIFWDPVVLIGDNGKLPAWQAVCLIWAICSGIICSVGFIPIKSFWKYFFYPPLAITIMFAFLLYFANENHFHL